MRQEDGQGLGYPPIFLLIAFMLLTAIFCGCASEQKGNVQYIHDGIEQYNAGNYNDALWSFERYLIDDENSTTAGYAWGWKGITYEELEKYDQALTCIDRAIQIRPDDPTLWTARQRILLELGRPDEAEWAGQKAANLENPSLSPLPPFTTPPLSPSPTASPFSERDRDFVLLVRDQTAQLAELTSRAASRSPSEYRIHGAMFQATANRFLQDVKKFSPDDPVLIQSWRRYQESLRQFGEAGAREEQAGKDFEANNYTAMNDSLQETVLLMEEGNANLSLVMELIDQSGFGTAG
jgi:tetratricopeptide (TPR) repeat protein